MKAFFSRSVIVRLLAILAITALGFVVYAWRSEIPPVDPPAADGFDAATIQRGAQLAALGDCATCHTARGGDSFAGGRPVSTPFGTIYSTNITPDPATGIGHWSEAAFRRAMREGVNRQGSHLYPAFPYDHFTLVDDADSAALYAFMMTRQPVQAQTPDNDLSFPLNIRLVLAGWKLLFLHEGPYRKDANHDEQWNRGAYLANGIAHCGACHTPRNGFGAEILGRHFDGGEADGWHAYAINSDSQAREAWDSHALQGFLCKGWHDRHGNAHGPMASVVRNLASLPDSDVRAIALYVASLTGQRHEAAKQPGHDTADTQSNDIGASIYSTTCASCHDGTRPLPFGGIKLALSTAVTGETAANLVNVVLDGLHPPEGVAGAIMPGFSSTLTDGQVESLVAYIRSNFGGKTPWTGLEGSVRVARGRDRD